MIGNVVDTVILAGVVGIVGTAVGASIQAYANLRQTSIQESEQTNRMEAELYLQHRVDVLTELHQKIALLQDSTSGYSTEFFDIEEMVPKFRDEKDNIMSIIDDAQEAHARAQIYLSDAESAVIARTIIMSINVYERMAEASGSRWADVDYDEKQYDKAFKHARGMLKLAIDKPATEYFDDEVVTDEATEKEIERIERVFEELKKENTESETD